MSQQKQTELFGSSPGDNFLLAMSPVAQAASLMGELNQRYLEMFAATAAMAFTAISRPQREVLRAIASPALPASWPQPYPANTLQMVDLGRSWFELMFRTPLAMTPLLKHTLADGSLGTPALSGRRVSAVVINFPERRQAGH